MLSPPLYAPVGSKSVFADDMAGNLKVCGIVPEPFRLVNGPVIIPGVFGAVATPACRLPGRSASWPCSDMFEGKEKRGDGWVVERWDGAVKGQQS